MEAQYKRGNSSQQIILITDCVVWVCLLSLSLCKSGFHDLLRDRKVDLTGWLWLSEDRRLVREEVTWLLGCFTQQGQRERRLVKTGSAVAAQAATNRSGV